MVLPNTQRLKELIHAVLCSPDSSKEFQVQYFEPEITGESSGLHLIVYQYSGDFQKEIVFEHGIDRWNPENHSKAKDFDELVQEAEHKLEKLVKQKFLSMKELQSYDDKIRNFYQTYFNSPTENVPNEYFIDKSKRVNDHFSDWLEKKFFPNINGKSFPNEEEFFFMYRKYCTFEC